MKHRGAATDGEHRAISTVLDAAIFLLLVSAAIGLLYTVPQSGDDATTDPDVAAEATTTLATSIQTIDYVPAPGGDTDAAAGRNRSDRGTIAELLAETTVANARLGGEQFTSAPNHEDAVRNVTLRTIQQIDGETVVEVRTHWRPLQGSGLRGGVVIGPSPPADADVHTATMAVPVGTATSTGPSTSDWIGDPFGAGRGPEPIGNHSDLAHGRNRSLVSVAGDEGCSGLAHVVASRVVGAAYPPERTQLARRAGGSPERLSRARSAVTARALGIGTEGLREGMDVRRRNELFASRLVPPLNTACGGSNSLASAVHSTTPGTVIVSVRTWSP